MKVKINNFNFNFKLVDHKAGFVGWDLESRRVSEKLVLVPSNDNFLRILKLGAVPRK